MTCLPVSKRAMICLAISLLYVNIIMTMPYFSIVSMIRPYSSNTTTYRKQPDTLITPSTMHTFSNTSNAVKSSGFLNSNAFVETDAVNEDADKAILLEINPKSTIATDIINIVHVPNESKIIINLKR